MVNTKLNLSMTEPYVRQIYAKEGDTGRVLEIGLDDYPTENGTLRILRPDGVEKTSDAESTVSPTITDGMATFDSLEEAEVTELKIALSPKQDLHGYANPWAGGAGKNLLNNTASSSSPSGITFTVNADGTVTATGTATADAQFQIPFSGLSGDYYFCGCPSGGNASTKYDVYAWDNTVTARFKKWNGTTTSASDVGTYSLQEIKIPSGHSGFIVIRIKSGYAIQGSLVFKPMIVASSVTDNSYAPYSNICPITGHDEVTVYFGAEQGTADETYTTSLGQTVYGGTLDVVSGKLTVTHAIEDLGALSWTKDSGSVRFYASLSLAKKPSTNDSVFNGISSVFVTTSLNYFGANKNEDGLMALSTGGALSARVISLMSGDATAFATAMSGQSVVYELATPTEIDLTPTQISTLLGENNVWSDGEITELTFDYGKLLSVLTSDQTAVVGRCLGDVNFTNVSTMPFTLNVIPNNQEETP